MWNYKEVFQLNRKALIVPTLGLSAMLLTGCVNKATTVKVQQGNETTIYHNAEVIRYNGILALDTGSHIVTVPQNATVDITKN